MALVFEPLRSGTSLPQNARGAEGSPRVDAIASGVPAQLAARTAVLENQRGSKATDHSLPGFRNTVGWSFDPSVPNSRQPHIAVIERGRAALDQLLPGGYDKLVALLTPAPEQVHRFKAVRAEIQTLNRAPIPRGRERAMRKKSMKGLLEVLEELALEMDRTAQAKHAQAITLMGLIRRRLLSSRTPALVQCAQLDIDPSASIWQEKISEWAARFFSMTGTEPPRSLRVTARKRRGSYEGSSATVELGAHPSERTLFHEFGHMIEVERPDLWQAAFAWRAARTREAGFDGMVVHLRGVYPDGAYGDDELAIPDHFVDDYVGKLYGSGSTEVVSMGFEHFTTPEDMTDLFIQDPEHFLFTVGVAKTKV